METSGPPVGRWATRRIVPAMEDELGYIRKQCNAVLAELVAEVGKGASGGSRASRRTMYRLGRNVKQIGAILDVLQLSCPQERRIAFVLIALDSFDDALF